MEDAPELKPCRFCGSTSSCIMGGGSVQVVCECMAAGPLLKTDAEAVVAWNTRADLSDAKDKRILGPQSPNEEAVFAYEARIFDLEIEVGKRDKRIEELEGGQILNRNAINRKQARIAELEAMNAELVGALDGALSTGEYSATDDWAEKATLALAKAKAIRALADDPEAMAEIKAKAGWA